MKNLIKKRILLLPLFLLVACCGLHAAKSMNERSTQVRRVACRVVPLLKRKLFVHGYCSGYSVPVDVCFLITYFVYGNPLGYKNNCLPADLSGQDLSGFDFTGCQFTHTNLTDTTLVDAILTNTTCDYQKAFQDNIKENNLQGRQWYQENIPQDLKSIARIYPKLENHRDKAQLLHIACALSRLPFYKDTEFEINLQYWSCTLLRLKQGLGQSYGHQLVCSLKGSLNYDARKFCWRTKYPQDSVNIGAKVAHTSFAQYVRDFQYGVVAYKCMSKEHSGLSKYKYRITSQIEGLQKAYSMIRDEQLQKEACNIACELSKSYQLQQWDLLHHYLFCQYRLIRLKRWVELGAKSYIRYAQNLFVGKYTL